MRRNLLLLTILSAILLFVVMNNQYIATVYNAKQALKSNIDYDTKLSLVEGILVDYNLENKTFVLKLSKFEGQKVQLKWQIRVKDVSTLTELIERKTYHVAIQVDLNQHQFTATKNRYAFDYDAYLFANNIKGQYYLVALDDAYSCDTFCLECFRLNVRTWIQNQLTSHFSEAQSGFLQALLLGEKSQFENYAFYKDLGLAHIFAISGLHFGIIYQYFRKILAFKSDIMRSLIILSFMAFILLLVGGAYSAQRAFYMILYAETCHLMHRKIDSYTNIAASLLIILSMHPEAILSTGLHLSYFAYICVAIIYRKLFGKALKSKILEAIRFSVGIQILLLPATLYYFQTANLYGFLSNALIVPMTAVILPLSMLFLLASSIRLTFLAWPLSKLLALGINVFYYVGNYLPLDLSYFVQFKKSDFYALLIYAFFLSCSLIFWRFFLKRRMLLKLLFVSIVLLFIAWNIANDRSITVSFFDVGHGDMSLIQNGQTTILIDTGDGKVSSHSILRSRGIHNLDVLILSHEHADHIGSALELMQNMKIEQIYMNQATYDKLLTYDQPLNDQNIMILEKPIEHVYDTHSNHALILSVIPIKGAKGDEDPNDDAIVVTLEYGHSLGFFLGDISTAVIDDLLSNQSATLSKHANIDFVKSAHHGSKTAINTNLYDNFGIDYVFTSCSTKYKMPTVKLDALLKSHSIYHYTTYESGEIDVTIMREGIKIKRFLEP